ncbi:MAG: hypothetical protein IV100_31880 [Myxococcales bacterium]|nr:hypothetical protein [Myxococcales bacterium]
MNFNTSYARLLSMGLAIMLGVVGCEKQAAASSSGTDGSGEYDADVTPAGDGTDGAADTSTATDVPSPGDATSTADISDATGASDLVDAPAPDAAEVDPDDALLNDDTADTCGGLVPVDVPIYVAPNQEPSTGRACLCYPDGTYCRWPKWDDEEAPKSLEDPRAACPDDEACDGWYDGQTWLSGTPGCRKRCFHPDASWDNGAYSSLGCAAGEYCKLVVLDGGDGQISGKHGLCFPIPLAGDSTGCEPLCTKDAPCE